MAAAAIIKMIFAVLDVLLIMGLNIGETDKVFFTLIIIINDNYQYVLASHTRTVMRKQ